ncbi:MAG: permease prefix domain 1-containing protein [Kofleriaceae bacterium]
MTDEQLIAKYKADLVGEAELARGDLDEIEDHLRTLADELRERGMPRVEAVREACKRLGDPRAVAREHARVRSPFGARLSRVRAWSAIALALPILIAGAFQIFPSSGPFSFFGLQIVFGTIVTLALAFRLPWARPVVLGGIAFFTMQVVIVTLTVSSRNPIWVVPYAGIFAFVMPWRRNELSSTGLAIALHVWAFAAASFALEFQTSNVTGVYYLAPGATIAFTGAAIATCGTIVRARWAMLGSLACAIKLVECAYLFGSPSMRYPLPASVQITILAMIGSGVIAATVGTMLSWRNARSTIGTLHHVLS